MGSGGFMMGSKATAALIRFNRRYSDFSEDPELGIEWHELLHDLIEAVEEDTEAFMNSVSREDPYA